MRRAALILALSLAATDVAAQSPLDRRVTIHLKDVALRDALDRVAILAGVRLSYSGDHLPLDRRVSVDRDSTPVADVLGDVLRGFPVAPVATASDHIVLTPRFSAEPDTVSRSIAVLERVVVTGSVLGSSERPLPIALDVIAGRDIERRHEGSLSDVLSGSVPGVWLWEHTPTSMLARYGSIRGASSFGLSFPKIYIDGIEVANPLLLTQITPEVVERVEVIRGPQGAALYGSDAISGVINIVSRHEGVSPDGDRALLRSNMGFSGSRYATTAQVPVQEHVLAIRSGSSLRSVGLTLGGASSGQYIPQAYSRELRGSVDARVIGTTSRLTAHARVHGKDAGVPTNPLLSAFNDSLASDDDPQKLRLYSAGSTLTLVPNERWTYSLTGGFDGYSLANVSNDQSPIPSVADTALRNANGSATRGTFRASAVRSLVSASGVGATLTFGAERSDLWDRTDVVGPSGSSPGAPPIIQESGRGTSTGFLGQAVVSFRDAAYVTAGLRRERIGQTYGPAQFSTLPLLGVAVVKDFTNVAVKFRAGYGKGIRPSRSTLHLATRDPRRTMRNPNLAPEQQAGLEAGADIRIGRVVGIHVTRFDQLVSGLIQAVTVTAPTSSGPGGKSSWYQLQNVGEISNKGWETQASFMKGPVSLSGAATFIDSRVQRLAFGYTGDLRVGDRMLAVPSRTLSGTASWSGRRGLQLSSTISRAYDWVNYDRLRIASRLIDAGATADDLTGSKLRMFWTTYPGAPRLRSSASVDLWRSISLNVTGENLLDYQRGEPDTITIVPGRTITVGLKARF
jgi:outer membrane receptor protein involved in Fe transport